MKFKKNKHLSANVIELVVMKSEVDRAQRFSAIILNEQAFVIAEDGSVINMDGKVLKSRPNGRHLIVSIPHKNDSRLYLSMLVHRIVFAAFNDTKNMDGLVIKHIDGNLLNCHLSNLKAVDKMEDFNSRGLHDENHYRVAVVQLSNGNEVARFNSIKEAAESTGIDQSNICKCCKGKLSTCSGYSFKKILTNEKRGK